MPRSQRRRLDLASHPAHGKGLLRDQHPLWLAWVKCWWLMGSSPARVSGTGFPPPAFSATEVQGVGETAASLPPPSGSCLASSEMPPA